jgi:hypothetical protein
MAATNVTTSLLASSKVTLAMSAEMYKVEPTGGVKRPIPKTMVVIRPKRIGSTPNLTAKGKKMGVKMRRDGARSRKHPVTK